MFKRKSKSDKPAKAKKAKKTKAPRKKAPRSTAPVNKAPTDIYTVMIVIATLAVTVGCILLMMELSRYGSYPWWKA